ncbi:MAG: YncE family protein, partial [Anaerolineae bacterium]
QGSKVFVANTDGTVTTFIPASVFSSVSDPTSVSLPAGLLPQFLYSADSSNMYVLATNNGAFTGCPDSAIVAMNAASDLVTQTACIGPDPGASRRSLTETPDGRKLYAVNGDGTISSINTVDFSANPPISPAVLNPALTTPVSVVASLDSSQVFVLDASGLIWTIDTFTDQPAAVSATPAGAGANFMYLERTHNRLYVASTAANTVSILNAAIQVPQAPTLIGTPLALPAGSTPSMITALPNGREVYVLSTSATNTPVLTALNPASETVTNIVALPAPTSNPAAVSLCQASRFPFSVAAAANSSRVYVTNCYAGSTTILDATTNVRILNLNSPTSAYAPVGSQTFPPPQNPVWVVAGP